ncbi:MAG: polysaccharide deacetylase family protein [Nitrospiraceae bacterium]|nr:polysaccharide deacetylase family protein [Nitrospiraceae bacterium]
MVSVCMYFQVHQPFRLRHYQVFDIGKSRDYFDTVENVRVLKKVASKCYLPANNHLLKLIKQHPDFKFAFSFSGVFLEQMERYMPELLDSFKELVATGNVEILSETYYHSLSFLYSKDEFKRQVELHKSKIKELFGVEPTVFRNTELIYNNDLADFVAKMGYKGILAEGADFILGWRSPNFIYNPVSNSNIKVLLKNYRLSDDIAFRFSNKGWKEWPLTVDKYVNWVNSVNGNGYSVNLFMDYETFGEHQWSDTGIFDFLDAFPKSVLNSGNDFKTPSEVVDAYPVMGNLDVPFAISWADIERDLSAWLGNDMQKDALSKIYSIEKEIMASGDKKLIDAWRKLQTSDHFYYMCTKYFNDGDVHKYFNPYDSPYDAYIYFMNVFQDLVMRLRNKKSVRRILIGKKSKSNSEHIERGPHHIGRVIGTHRISEHVDAV